MKNFRCMVCGYIHTGLTPPPNCPICDAPASQFELYEPEVVLDVKSKGTGTESIQEFDTDIHEVVIVGGGIAALSAAETLRQNNKDIKITLITNETKLPYYRLNLTRFLAGEVSEGGLCIHSQYWYDEQRIQIFKNRVVVSIDSKAKEIETADGLKVPYDRLIVALGAHAFIPPIEGINQEGITCIRQMDEVKGLKLEMVKEKSAMIIGGGVLGLETAGALAKCGVKVTIAEGAAYLMPRQLNKKASAFVAEALKDMGIEVLYDFRTERIEKKDNGFKVYGQDNREIEADKVIVTTGVRPNTYLVRQAGLNVDRGMVVNDYMQSSDPHIFGAGDITEHYGVVYGLWSVAQYQGRIAALNLLGIKTAFGGVPRSNSLKVLDIGLFSVGEINTLDGSYYTKEKVTDHTYLCFILKDQKVVGAISVGYEESMVKLQALVESERSLTMDQTKSFESIMALVV